MKTIAIINEKGGVGKTSTALNLAQCLIKMGKKVLFIDLDPQLNGTNTYKAKTKKTTTLCDLFMDEFNLALRNIDEEDAEDPNEAIQTTELGQILPGDRLLVNDAPRYQTDQEGAYLLKRICDKVKDKFEYCVIDTGPQAGVYQLNAMVAADRIVIPIQADRFSIDGLTTVIQTIDRVKKTQNPNVEISGMLLTFFDARLTVDKGVRNSLPEIAKAVNVPYFKNLIRTDATIKTANNNYENLITDYPKSKGAEDYMAVTKELLKKEKWK